MTLAQRLAALRQALAEEATPNPGASLAYGRPHAHPRARFYPRYSPTGERLTGSVRVRPDCPRPVKGRCECPPDGSWRPAVGVVRADAIARYATRVPASRLRVALEGTLWVDEVYEQGPDGLWRCRWPVRRALERQRAADPAAFAVAIRLLEGVHPSRAWAAGGVPPGPEQAALRILARIESWATEERDTEWERRPRQWWDKPKVRSQSKSEAQMVAEHDPNVTGALRPDGEAATLPPTGPAQPVIPVHRIGRGSPVRRPASPANQAPCATASPEAACA